MVLQKGRWTRPSCFTRTTGLWHREHTILSDQVVASTNHYGSRSWRGTKVATLFYSLIESAKLTGLEPATYLQLATERAILTPGTVTLPHDLLDN